MVRDRIDSDGWGSVLEQMFWALTLCREVTSAIHPVQHADKPKDPAPHSDDGERMTAQT